MVSFSFADLLIIPILVIYRKYYGKKMAIFLALTFYGASVLAGYAVELLFGVTQLIPTERTARVEMANVSWNYTTYLNLAFLLLAIVLIVRFLRTDGRQMLSMMGGGPDNMDHHGNEPHDDHTDHGGHGGHGGHRGHGGHDGHDGHDEHDEHDQHDRTTSTTSTTATSLATPTRPEQATTPPGTVLTYRPAATRCLRTARLTIPDTPDPTPTPGPT